MCKAESEEELRDWFYQCYQYYDQLDCHYVIQIDDLGGLPDDVKHNLSEAEFLVVARKVKELHLAWLEKMRLAREEQAQPASPEPSIEEPDAMNESPSPQVMPSPSGVRGYRLWVWVCRS